MIRGVAKSGLFFVLALLSQGAQSSPLEECLENSTNEMEIRQCLAAVYAKADKDLNAVYRESLKNAKQISSETHTNLIASERAWIRLRDAECNFQASWEQGSLGARARMWCLAETPAVNSIYARHGSYKESLDVRVELTCVGPHTQPLCNFACSLWNRVDGIKSNTGKTEIILRIGRCNAGDVDPVD